QDVLDRQGAGDQGLMFGYACDETPELMPLPILLSHRLAERLAAVRRNGEVAGLRPDGKTQATIRYEGARPVAVESVVMSSQHDPDPRVVSSLRGVLLEQVIDPVLQDFAGRMDLDVGG